MKINTKKKIPGASIKLQPFTPVQHPSRTVLISNQLQLSILHLHSPYQWSVWVAHCPLQDGGALHSGTGSLADRNSLYIQENLLPIFFR